MKCPYCNEQMELGDFVTSADSGLIWLPKEETIFPLRMWSKEIIAEKNGILLSKKLAYKKVSANVCRKCNKGVFEF